MRRRGWITVSLIVLVTILGLASTDRSEGGRQGRSVSAASRGQIVLGSSTFVHNGVGWGTARPRVIFNGGDPSGRVSNIHWSSWGGKVAAGRGLNAIFRPNGGYYSKLAVMELRASGIGRCHRGGPRAYVHLSVRVPSRPGGPFGRWFAWSGVHNLCHYG